MAKHQRGHSERVTVPNQTHPRSHKGQPRLVIPPLAGAQRSQVALNQLMEDWLLPRLLSEFLKEHGVTPKSHFLAKPQ
jgi:hypothetical protein